MKAIITILILAGFMICCSNHEKGKTEKPEVQLLASPAKDSCAEPFLYTDRNGTVFLSWVEKKGRENRLLFSAFEQDAWTAPETIASGSNWFVNWADYPVICTNGDSNMLAHYLEKSATGKYTYDVKYVTSADRGTTWSNARILHNDGVEAEHGFVSMIPYGDKYFVTWLDGRNTGMDDDHGGHEGHHGTMTLRGAVLDKTGNKEREWELDNRVCDCCQTSVTMTNNGPVVLYRDRSEEEIRDISIVRFENGQPSLPAVISADQWKIAGCPVNGPQAAALGKDVAVAWFSMPDNQPQVKVIFSADGGKTFGKPIRIDEGKTIGRVDVVMQNNKTAVVSWMESDTIKATKVYSNGSVEPAITIAVSSSARAAGFPQMASWGNSLFFAWTDSKEQTIKVARMLW